MQKKAILAVIVSLAGALIPAAAADLNAVYDQPLEIPRPSCNLMTNVKGVLFGRPFVADQALINSRSIVLRQRHGMYCRIVVNFMALHMDPAGHDFRSKGNPQPRVEIHQKLKHGEKLHSQIFENNLGASKYALNVKFGRRIMCYGPDTTGGAINLRFANGDYVSGVFTAKQSPKIIWDDEEILD